MPEKEDKNLKDKELQEANGGQWDPSLGYKKICNDCGEEFWSNIHMGPGNTCPRCGSSSLRDA